MTAEFLMPALAIGIGATIVMDLWAMMQNRLFNVPSLNYAMVGRWLGHMGHGRFTHQNIMTAAPVAGEAIIGWVAHYGIGIAFAAALLFLAGLDWVQSPTILPALAFGTATVIMPFFVMQPGFGFGVAASKTPKPMVARFRSLVAHLSFGVGLYAAAWGYALLV